MDNLWACEQASLERYLADNEAAIQLALENPQILASMRNDEDSDENDIDDILDMDGENASIAITGVMTPNGPSPIARFFGVRGTSYKAIAGAVQKAQASGAKCLTLDIDSPGGQILGLDAAWAAVRAFPGFKATMNRGCMASAAYGLGSAVGPGNIYSSSDFNLVGSIGIMAEVTDDSKLQERIGVKTRSFVSKNAPLKNADPATDAGAKAMQARLDATERLFHARIAEGRGVAADYIAEHYGRGDVFVSQDQDTSKPSGRSLGMVDHIAASIPLPKSIPEYLRTTISGQAQPEPIQAAAPQSSKPSAVADKEKRMNLDDFLKENPDAAAAINTRLAAARETGMAEARANALKIGTILSSDAYKANSVIQAKGLEALQGKISVESFDTIVGTVDAITAASKIAAEAAAATKETAPLLATAAADLVAKATALKIDAAKVQAAAKAQGMDPAKALEGEIALAEMVATDKGQA